MSESHTDDFRYWLLAVCLLMLVGCGGGGGSSPSSSPTAQPPSCSETPQGAELDELGCPSDADGDGSFDGLDKCPATPAEYANQVGADGCHIIEPLVEVVYAINAGGESIITDDGTPYQSDNFYTEGATRNNDHTFANTSDEALYQTERHGNFSYTLPVTSGRYRVELQFSETIWEETNQRSFDVSIEGVRIAYKFDLVAVSGGRDRTYRLTHALAVDDGMLNIALNGVIGEAQLSAMMITRSIETDTGIDGDADEDGVIDTADECAHTPLGDTTYSNGCSEDQLAGDCRNPDADTVIAQNATITRITSSPLGLPEGPAADSQGNLYFTDIPNSIIYRYSTDGELSTFINGSNRANGMHFDANDQLYISETATARIAKLDPGTVSTEDPDGDRHSVASLSNGIPFNQTNDLWIAPNGGIYFTDPCYDCTTPLSQGSEQVFYVTPDRTEVRRVTFNLIQPNGILGTPDGKVLFVSDANEAKKVYRYTIEKDGSLSNQEEFIALGSDGMTMDCENNLYLAARPPGGPHYIGVYNMHGEEKEKIYIEKTATNVAFGGADRDILFITAGSSLYAIKTRVRGLPNMGARQAD